MRGVYPAIVTPFAEDGAIDEAAFIRLLAWHESVGCNGVVVCGTNGESASLTLRERQQLVTLATQHRGRLQIVAGTGSSSLGETIHLTHHAADTGCVAALVMPPYYFKNPPQEGVLGYFMKLLDVARLPVLVYNIPQITDTPIGLDVVRALAGHENLGGLKDSSGDLDNLLKCIEILKGKWVLVGAEQLLTDCLRAGGVGTVSGASNAYPELAVAVVRAFDEGRDPLPNQERLTEMNAVLRSFPVPAGAKAVLRARGLPGGHMRLPLMDVAPDQVAELLARLSDLGLPTSA